MSLEVEMLCKRRRRTTTRGITRRRGRDRKISQEMKNIGKIGDITCNQSIQKASAVACVYKR